MIPPESEAIDEAEQTRRSALGTVASLDGFRAVAVLLVMAYHAGIAGFAGGNVGVDVFFVLSGFLITTLLLEEHERNGAIGLKAFYMRRVLRLYPALVVAVVGAIVLAALKVPVFDASAQTLATTVRAGPFALLYSMNVVRAAGWTSGGFLGHTWSLAIEEQFYVVWPVVVIAAMRLRRTPTAVGWIAVGCAITSAALRALLHVLGFDGEMLYNATFTHVDGIFAGCAIAVVWLLRPQKLRRFASLPWAIGAAASVTVIVVRGQHMNVYGFLVAVLATVLLLSHLLVYRRSRLSAALSHPWAVGVGRRSYGIYLYHWPIFLFIGMDQRPAVLALGFALTFMAAWASYAVIERPFLRRKEQWSSNKALGN